MIEHTPHTVELTLVDHTDAVNLIAQGIADYGPLNDVDERGGLAAYILKVLANAHILLMGPSKSGKQ
jgi:hypothetical protein